MSKKKIGLGGEKMREMSWKISKRKIGLESARKYSEIESSGKLEKECAACSKNVNESVSDLGSERKGIC